jgi:hypothetical protein
VLAPQVRHRVKRQQRHPGRQRQRDHRSRRLQDRRAFPPARCDELGRCEAGQARDEQDDHVGEGKKKPLDRPRDGAEHDADAGMIAAPVRHGPADERQDREGEPRHLVGPQKGMLQERARQHVGEHENELAEQRQREQSVGRHVETAPDRARRRSHVERAGFCLEEPALRHRTMSSPELRPAQPSRRSSIVFLPDRRPPCASGSR